MCVASGARTAYGLLRSAIDDPDPVVLLEPRLLYGEREDTDFPSGFRMPLGQAEVVRKGKDATIVTAGAMLRVAVEAAEKNGLDVEIIDLLTLWPWDRATVLASVKKTGRLITVEEAPAEEAPADEAPAEEAPPQ